VQVGEPRTGDQAARALTDSLSGFGVEATYVGIHEDAEPIAAAAVAARADSVEVCLRRGTGIPILRDLLRELIRIGKREVSIVVHRVE
jgi:methylmalonyl-CoA mutase cobalamin-binding subunit